MAIEFGTNMVRNTQAQEPEAWEGPLRTSDSLRSPDLSGTVKNSHAISHVSKEFLEIFLSI